MCRKFSRKTTRIFEMEQLYFLIFSLEVRSNTDGRNVKTCRKPPLHQVTQRGFAVFIVKLKLWVRSATYIRRRETKSKEHDCSILLLFPSEQVLYVLIEEAGKRQEYTAFKFHIAFLNKRIHPFWVAYTINIRKCHVSSHHSRVWLSQTQAL